MDNNIKNFQSKINIFSKNILKIFLYIKKNYKNEPQTIFTKKIYSELITSSRLLEDFLDFHGAKNNKEWYFYRELVATVEHISLAAYSQKHIRNRLPFYKIEKIEGFELDIETTNSFLENTLYNIALIITKEAKKLNIKIPSNTYKKEDYPIITTKDILESNIEDIDKVKQKENIARIANNFINMVETFNDFMIYKQYNINEIKEMIPVKINVVEIRRFEMMLHNLQSYFDSYIIYNATCLRKETNKSLIEMRGYFSISFHLLQIVGRLLHYYERHLYDKGYKDTYKNCLANLKEIINVDDLLDSILNYGLYYVSLFLTIGKKKAQKILDEHIEESSIVVPVPRDTGFHFRPSKMVASIVKHYGSKVILKVDNKEFDAGSMLEITWAGGFIKRKNIKEVTFKGDKRALKDIKILASLNYAEDMMGNKVSFPNNLNYLWNDSNEIHKDEN